MASLRMQKKQSSGSNASWAASAIRELDQRGGDGTVVLILNKSEFDLIAPTIIGPQATGDDFIADLKMHKTYWFYHLETKKRCLLVFYSVKVGATSQE